MSDTYTTPPHFRPRELWRLHILNEGVVQCLYLPVEKAAVLKVNGTMQDFVRCEKEEDTLRVAANCHPLKSTNVCRAHPNQPRDLARYPLYFRHLRNGDTRHFV